MKLIVTCLVSVRYELLSLEKEVYVEPEILNKNAGMMNNYLATEYEKNKDFFKGVYQT